LIKGNRMNIFERFYTQIKNWLWHLGHKPLLPSVRVESGLPRLYFRAPLQLRALQKNIFQRYYERLISYFNNG
jgi:hypothetical protein